MTGPQTRSVRSAVPAVAAALITLALIPAHASAGTYVVHSCRLPNGAPGEAVGWSAARSGANGPHAQDRCEQGGALTAGFSQVGDHHTPWVTWTFRAPSDVSVERFTYWRYARVHYAERSSYREASNYSAGAEGQAASPDRCFGFGTPCREKGRPTADPFDAANRVESVDGIPPSFWMNCGRSGGVAGCPSYTYPRMVIYAARITMRDDSHPTISGIGGTLLGARDLRDSASLDVLAADRGSGVRAVALEVDGREVREERFQASSSRCREPFTRAQPCALEGAHRLQLDTRQLADGAHRLRVVVRDAAGNVTASRPYSIAVNNGGASCPYGSGPKLRAGFGRRGLRSSLTVASNRRALVNGRLLSQSGSPRGGAPLRVLTRTSGSAEWRQAAHPITRQDGRFRVRVPRGASRLVRITYCGRDGGHYRDLRLRAKPSVGLRANRRRVRNGRSVVFSGRVRSKPLPAGGKLVELQAFFRGRWRTFQTLHTNRRGTFRFRYWFGGTQGTVRYGFRARIPREGGYPYATGASRRVTVTVRG